MWGATARCRSRQLTRQDFNPRTPMWGATPPSVMPSRMVIFQSAHPYVGCDDKYRRPRPCRIYFNPRTPMWGATFPEILVVPMTSDFNPRTPMWGATFIASNVSVPRDYFNPRTPMWGATYRSQDVISLTVISIRAPLCGVRLSDIQNTTIPAIISIRAPLCGVRHPI